MSYDVYLMDPDEYCAHCGRHDCDFYEWNYTSNVAPMWRKAMPDTDGLAGLNGMVASDAAKVLRGGISHMAQHPEEYRPLDPPNGWGSYDGVLVAMGELLREMDNHPTALVKVSA